MPRLLLLLAWSLLLVVPVQAATLAPAGSAPGRATGAAVLPDGTLRVGLTGVAARRNGLATVAPGSGLGLVRTLPGRAGGGDDLVVPTADGGGVVLSIDLDGVRLSTLRPDGSSMLGALRPGRFDTAFPELAVAADGSAVALWLDGTQQRTRVRYAIRAPGGPFAPARTLPGRFGDIEGVATAVAAGPDGTALITARDEIGPQTVVLVRGGRPVLTTRLPHRTGVSIAVGADGTAGLATQWGATVALRTAGPMARTYAAPVAVRAGSKRLTGTSALAVAADGTPLLLLADPDDFAHVDLRRGPQARTSRVLALGALGDDSQVLPVPGGGAVLSGISDYSESAQDETGTTFALVASDGSLTTTTLPPPTGNGFATGSTATVSPAGALVFTQTTSGRSGDRTTLYRLVP